MRVPGKNDLQMLTKLSRVREKAALAELSAATARRNAALARVDALKNMTLEVVETSEPAVLQKWLLWRDQELVRRQGQLARLAAEHLETSQRCGRVIAENAVVEDLVEIARSDAKVENQKRALYDQAISSHLLSHDVGDQDV